jgi:D-glycero-beta-D-manno-heptose-7-phosphate kinase
MSTRLTPVASRARLRTAVKSFPDCRVLVIGDLMLDIFVWGEVRRISPEAPVPVVEVRGETRHPGGAANVVHNVASLGGRVAAGGVIGADAAGNELTELLLEKSVPAEGMVVAPDRPTTVKTRVIAQNQQVVRFDRENDRPLDPDSIRRLLSFIEANLSGCQVAVVSDYAKGVVCEPLLDGLRELAGRANVPVIVDPKVQHASLYRRFTVVTPNHHEAAQMAGIPIRDEPTLLTAGRRLLERLECRDLLITRGKDGMILFSGGADPVPIPTVAKQVYDVTGAGDTVAAVLALGIAAGLSTLEACILANLAAGIVVGEVGTAAVTSAQLLSAVEEKIKE